MEGLVRSTAGRLHHRLLSKQKRRDRKVISLVDAVRYQLYCIVSRQSLIFDVRHYIFLPSKQIGDDVSTTDPWFNLIGVVFFKLFVEVAPPVNRIDKGQLIPDRFIPSGINCPIRACSVKRQYVHGTFLLSQENRGLVERGRIASVASGPISEESKEGLSSNVVEATRHVE